MKKGIGKTISLITVLTLIFQMLIPIIPELDIEVLAADETSENTEEISRNYEIKEEETWDISKNRDGSIIAKWTLNNKTLTISGTGEMKNWTSYSEEDWHDTQYTEVIEKVIIENGITRIGEEAFAGCTSLKSIEIPESLVSIATEAFMDCESLSEIDLSKNVSIIGSWAFRGCFSLQYVELSSKIEEIFNYAFESTGLKEITIPKQVVSIGTETFSDCPNLEKFNVDAENENYMSEDGILFSKDKATLVKFPAKKETIENYEIPSSVRTLETGAFDSCNLISVMIPDTVLEVKSSIFENSQKLENVTLPKDMSNIPSSIFMRCTNLKSIEIPEKVSSIGMYAFYGCENLETIEIPNTVTKIERDAFENCSKLKNVNIPNGITEIDLYTFKGCISLENIEMPIGVTKIRTSAFSGCESLKSIKIPESVTYIGESVFTGCTSLKEIEMANVIEMEKYIFRNCTSLENVILSKGLTEIPTEAFENCTNLENINIPSSVITIDWEAFAGCTNLKNITIPENVITIGEYAIPSKTIMHVKADTKGHEYAENNKIYYILDGEAVNITTNYEMKIEQEKTWNISSKEDGSMIAKWTAENKTIEISGEGEKSEAKRS